ncbi:porin family protein [Lentimicrobium sp.]
MNSLKSLKLTLALLLFTGGYLLAQESTVGIKGGLNLSTISADGGDDKNLKPGFHLGVFTNVGINEAIGFQPELLFSNTGLKINYDGAIITDGETRFNLNYLELPLYLTVNMIETFRFQVGPYVRYLLSADVETDATVFNYFEIDSNDELDRKNFNAFDYGLAAGIAFNFNALELGVNYTLGLNQVAKDDEPSYKLLGDGKNRVIQVYAGIKF